LAVGLVCFSSVVAAAGPRQFPILVYHRFGPTAADTMTVRTTVFETHLRRLEETAYEVVPLQRFVDYRLGKGLEPPERTLAITVDDAHISVYSDMLPLVLRHRVPVTLFVYPSAVSNAPYAMTWEQLAVLRDTGFFNIQSHTYWHPNFRHEKKRLAPEQYRAFATMQFARAKRILEDRLAQPVNLLAWPFGIYDDELRLLAAREGYVAGFTIERRKATVLDDSMALPRYLISDSDRDKLFDEIIGHARIARPTAP
jgi:peptidoglycan/xylan/chitin deacetylase (PgdA/CDA1 family)